MYAVYGISTTCMYTVYDISTTRIYTVYGVSTTCMYTVYDIYTTCMYTVYGISTTCMYTVLYYSGISTTCMYAVMYFSWKTPDQFHAPTTSPEAMQPVLQKWLGGFLANCLFTPPHMFVTGLRLGLCT